MNFYCLTLFPELVETVFNTSITGRALKNQKLNLECVNIRDFSHDKHGKVDDYTYGGGAGLLMQANPVYEAYQSVASKLDKPARVLYMSPQGRTFDQKMAIELAGEENLIFLCGHYEGIDERVISEIVTDEISLGDFVLTGGELAASVMMDAISRMVPGVLHNETSGETDSFYNGLLEYPQYTRPEVWHEKKVPKVLLAGAHEPVEIWREKESLIRTRKKRPDLYKEYRRKNPIAPTRAKRMHLSVDDFFKALADLSDFPKQYESVFSHPEFALLQSLHETYGAVFSLYCFYVDEESGRCLENLKLEKKFSDELKASASWLRFGSHTLTDYEKCVRKLESMVGSEGIDTLPRIHYFAGTFEECKKARDAGASGFLTADDTRVSYYHEDKLYNDLKDLGVTYDPLSDLFFVRTDVRLEKTEDVWNTLKPYARDKVNRSMVIFTHERYLSDPEALMDKKLETACKFASKNAYSFEYPMDWMN